MKVNKILGLILLILSILTIPIYNLTFFVDRQLATNIFIYNCFAFLIVGFIWFVSLFFIRKEEGGKFKIFFKMIGKLLLVFVLLVINMFLFK
jgi:hypothetical protein